MLYELKDWYFRNGLWAVVALIAAWYVTYSLGHVDAGPDDLFASAFTHLCDVVYPWALTVTSIATGLFLFFGWMAFSD